MREDFAAGSDHWHAVQIHYHLSAESMLSMIPFLHYSLTWRVCLRSTSPSLSLRDHLPPHGFSDVFGGRLRTQQHLLALLLELVGAPVGLRTRTECVRSVPREGLWSVRQAAVDRLHVIRIM